MRNPLQINIIFTKYAKHKAYKLLYGNEYDFEVEDTVWKELLVFLVNTNQKSDWLDFFILSTRTE
jgi:hypothetical protein